ncbi:MAG: aminotransferase class IV family protein [Myxococcales bacterium]|nr:aminotransferase class IV family protein [Myxococcales bacterium]
MSVYIAIDGEVRPAAEARLPALDRGLLYGRSVYEVLPTVKLRPLFWREHLERLAESARRLDIALPCDAATLRAEMAAVTAQVGGEAQLRVVLTAGDDPEYGGDGRSRRLVIGRPRVPLPPEIYEQGCALVTVRSGRRDEGMLDPRAKSAANKLIAEGNAAAAHAKGAHEALRVDPLGRVLEGATSTFFAVLDGVLCTPPLAVGILAGITRAKVLDLAAQIGLRVAEQPLHEADLDRLDEAFITSSSRGVLPVTRIDARRCPGPGPQTGRLAAAYDALVAAYDDGA